MLSSCASNGILAGDDDACNMLSKRRACPIAYYNRVGSCRDARNSPGRRHYAGDRNRVVQYHGEFMADNGVRSRGLADILAMRLRIERNPSERSILRLNSSVGSRGRQESRPQVFLHLAEEVMRDVLGLFYVLLLIRLQYFVLMFDAVQDGLKKSVPVM